MKNLIVITGASSGIGRATAKKFSLEGYPLLLIARRLVPMLELDLPKTLCRSVDVSDIPNFKSAVEEAEAQYGPVDLLVNNAGYMNLESSGIQSPVEWQKQFDVNCVGLLNMTSVIFPKMITRKSGTIINIGSTAGKNISEFHTAYNGTKFAVHAMTEALRREGYPHNVRVSLVAPGLTETELSNGTSNPNILKAREEYKTNIGGALTAETIAEAVLFIYQQPHNVCIREMTVAPTGQIG